MSNIQLIIEERAASIGNMLVGRMLPFVQKRSVGAFVFIDHLGPVKMKDRDNLDVLPHPHIGLCTLTYLFDGVITHRDSIGTFRDIFPGEVNLMKAGKGVVHSERTPHRLRNSDKTLHGLQIWIALPKTLEQSEPSFWHISKEDIPSWHQNGIDIKLIAGDAFGKTSPVPTYTPLYFIEIKAKQNTTVDVGKHLYGESALYVLEGEIIIEGERFTGKKLLVAKDSSLCSFEIKENTTVYIFGGEALPEPRYIDWNFVSSDKNVIERAKKDWAEHNFPKIEGETEFIPYPSFKLKG